MKTAVEQLMIDLLGKDFRILVIDYQLKAFKKALKKEKKQIKNAYNNGRDINDAYGTSEDYYLTITNNI